MDPIPKKNISDDWVQCAICLEVMDDPANPPMTERKGLHTYHRDCIAGWAAQVAPNKFYLGRYSFFRRVHEWTGNRLIPEFFFQENFGGVSCPDCRRGFRLDDMVVNDAMLEAARTRKIPQHWERIIPTELAGQNAAVAVDGAAVVADGDGIALGEDGADIAGDQVVDQNALFWQNIAMMIIRLQAWNQTWTGCLCLCACRIISGVVGLLALVCASMLCIIGTIAVLFRRCIQTICGQG